MKIPLPTYLILLVAMFSACDNRIELPPIPAQRWNEMDVHIETHPNPPLAGMSEVIVIVTAARGRPVHDLIVSLRSNDTAPWVQAIQDGHIGVYRRGVALGFGESVLLQVRLQQREKKQVLFFPLQMATG